MIGCLWSVKDLLVGRWSVAGGRWVGGGPAGGPVIGGWWPVGGRWFCNTPSWEIALKRFSKEVAEFILCFSVQLLTKNHFHFGIFLMIKLIPSEKIFERSAGVVLLLVKQSNCWSY